MTENIEIVFSMPDYINVGEEFTVGYTITNPFNDIVDVYIGVYVNESLVKTIENKVEPLSTVSGVFTLVPDSSPFVFTIKGEAYIDNVLIGVGSVDIEMTESKLKTSIPLLVVGLGSILAGGLSEYRQKG